VREERDQESCGLAGAGLRLPCNVESRERARQRLRLDRGAALEARIGNAAGDGIRQVESGERKVGELLLRHRLATLKDIT
jgi:hypothetical protein